MTHNVLNTTTPELYGQQATPAKGMLTAEQPDAQEAEGIKALTATDTSAGASAMPEGEEGEPVKTATIATPSPWADGFTQGLDKNPEMSIADAINSYNAYAKENQKEPLDIMQIYSVLQGNDPLKSKEQNEEDRRKTEHRERWEQTANVLSHLGNFIGALAGAPDQGIESSTELTKRQQLLRDKTLEQRRQMSNDYLKVYQAQQASELAKSKEARAQQQQDRLDAELFLKQKQLEWRVKESEGKMDLAQQKLELERTKTEIMRQVQMGRLSQGAARIALAQLNYDLKKAGSTTTTTKSDGSTQTVVRTPGSTAASAGGGQHQKKKIDY